jgi:hypothetical protein
MLFVSTSSRRRKARIAKRSNRALLQNLESRMLLSVSVTEYAAATSILTSSHTVQDSSGFIYSMASGGGLVKFDPVTGADTFIDIAHQTANPNGYFLNNADLTIASDGNFWITETFFDPNAVNPEDFFIGEVIEVSPSGNVLSSFNLGTSHAFAFSPNFGPDGKLYIASFGIGTPTVDGDSTFNNAIIELNTGGGFTVHPVTRTDANMTDLKITADGDVIVALTGHSFEPPVDPAYQTDSSLAVLHNGNVINVALDGAANPKNLTGSIAIAGDGSVWIPLAYGGNSFSGGANQIVKAVFDSSFVATYTSYEITGVAPDDPIFALGVVAATDGNIYITESNGVNVDVFNTTTETVTRVAVPSGNNALTTPAQYGSSIYFGILAGNNFARIDLPLSGSGVFIAGFAGQSLTDTVAILDTTLNSADILGLTAVIYWGDNSSSAGTIVDNGNGTISIDGTHTYATDGDYITKIVVSGTTIDPVTVLGDATILAGNVFDAAGVPVPAQQENTTFSVVVASFVGPADSYTATIDWGNGVTTNGSIMLVSGVYHVVGTINYATQGNYTITVAVAGTLNAETVTTSVAVGDVPLVLTAVQPVVLAGKISQGPIAYFTDDIDSAKQNYDASINWGDGNTSKGTVQKLSAGSYVVMGNHNYKKKTTGTFTITTTVLTVSGEDAGASASVSVQVTI